MEYQRQQLLVEKQQFHQEQLKLAEMRARASHVTAASPAGSESAQPQVSAASGSPQPVQHVQPMSNQPARVPTPGTTNILIFHYIIFHIIFLYAFEFAQLENKIDFIIV